MNEQTIELINNLATSLGANAEQLIGWFALRAPYEFIDVFAAVTVFALLIYGMYSLCKSEDEDKKKHDDEEERLYQEAQKNDNVPNYTKKKYEISEGATFIFLLLLFSTLGAGIGVFAESKEALVALASPEAYAVEEILKAIRD